jgi:N-acetylmuramoyl-L-alanine amidase
MSKLTHYVIHYTATPKGRMVSGDDLRKWHIGPAKVEGGYRYKGKVYPTVQSLPMETIGGVPIDKLIGGRGWRQVGYADLIHLDGRVENLVPYDENDQVDPWEITNGILSSNELFDNARHIVYAGGGTGQDTRTPEQITSMINKVKQTINRHPDILILGHNQIDKTGCPGFNVPEWLRSIGVEEKNISKEPIKYGL